MIAPVRVLGGLLVVVGLLGLAAIGFTAYQNASRGEYAICDERVLTQGLPRDVLTDAEGDPDFSWFPVGTACSWPTINSTTIVTHDDADWARTAAIYAMLAGGVAGIVLLGRDALRDASTGRRRAI